MPIDTRRLGEREFAANLIENEVAPSEGGKKDKTARAGQVGATGGNLTVEHADAQGQGASASAQGLGASQPAQVQLPAPPAMSATEMMMLVQSLQSKTSANQESSTSNQLAISHQKMTDSIKKYEDNIKKEAEEAKKAKHKKSVSEWISGAIDAVEFVAGAALVATGVGTVAGVALMATAVVNATDLALTASGAVKPNTEGAKILSGITIAADVSIAVVTLGAGAYAGVMNAAIETGTEVGADAIESGTEVAEDAASDSADDIPDDESEVDDGSDSASESVDSADDESDGLKQLEKMFDKELEEEFSESFAEDTVEDTGDSGDDDQVPKRTKGQIIKAAVKATFGLYTKGVGIAGAGTGADQTWNAVAQHALAHKELDYAGQAEDAQKGEQIALTDIKSAIGQMQTQLDEYQKISKAVTGVLQQYESSMTDTGVRGFA